MDAKYANDLEEKLTPWVVEAFPFARLGEGLRGESTS
jgi:hypothetical protein